MRSTDTKRNLRRSVSRLVALAALAASGFLVSTSSATLHAGEATPEKCGNWQPSGAVCVPDPLDAKHCAKETPCPPQSAETVRSEKDPVKWQPSGLAEEA